MKNKELHIIEIKYPNGKLIVRKRRGIKQHLFVDTYNEFKRGVYNEIKISVKKYNKIETI